MSQPGVGGGRGAAGLGACLGHEAKPREKARAPDDGVVANGGVIVADEVVVQSAGVDDESQGGNENEVVAGRWDMHRYLLGLFALLNFVRSRRSVRFF